MTVTTRLEQHLGERFSAHTRRAYLSYARRFVEGAGLKESYDRQDVLAHVDRLIRAGYRETSIHHNLIALRAFFRVEGWEWPLLAGDLRLGLPQEEPNAPSILPAEIRLLISSLRGQTGFPAAAACLSTIFGLRPDEIARALGQPGDGRTLVIQTAKGGRRREHLIPGILARSLTHPAWTVSTDRLHSEFERLMRLYVREPLPREGWHAVRRTLVTQLYEANVKVWDIHRWFGWKQIKEISFRYYKPSAAHLDQVIFDAHPFLADWRTP